ncbi:MAG: class I SAM-dependent methyltransferase [Armatimonadetes bacterium]|nr:class I SAM-dependent methyltransferase [Armatimonadota bacterium]
MDQGRLAEIARKVGQDWIETDYYDKAESEEWTNIFWAPNSAFRPMFDRLDTTRILEIACGRGRHSAQLIGKPGEKWMSDINVPNIEHCQKRFKGMADFHAFVGNGYDLRPIEDSSMTAAFCYDAMVHFDSEVVLSYLQETYRVLKPGGFGLFHHSNNDASPGANYQDNTHWRNFMSVKLFAHYAIKSGLRVVESKVINWSGQICLDAITLVYRPDSK